MINLKTTFTAVTVFAMVLALAPTEVMAKRIKCWTNNDGVRECGYKVPPEYAQKRHEELSKHGTVIKEQEAAKTPEELAAIRAEREQKRKEEAERKRLEKEQAARDRVLLDTFTTEEDLELARKGKLQAIDTRIHHAESRVKKLHESLEKLQDEAATLERSGKQVPEGLQKNISGVQRQIGENDDFIKERREEEVHVNAKFDDDLERYRELKAMGRH
jgi:DNA repair exonuclease SbcCD ATPase subunit